MMQRPHKRQTQKIHYNDDIIPQFAHSSYQIKLKTVDAEDIQERHIQPQTLNRITETLGAINTVGRYLVNMTRNSDGTQQSSGDLPGALYTISKNVLGRNVTDTIAPFVREVVPVLAPKPAKPAKPAKPVIIITTPRPIIITTSTAPPVLEQDSAPKIGTGVNSASRTCTSPDGTKGICDDLSNCPQLLLNLGGLRQSLCFKSLFVPGVCCPIDTDDVGVVTTTNRPLILTARPVEPTRTTPAFLVESTSLKPRPQEIPSSSLDILSNNTLMVDSEGKFRIVPGVIAFVRQMPTLSFNIGSK